MAQAIAPNKPSPNKPSPNKPGANKLRRRKNLRPAGFDELGLRRALDDRMLPALVAAMAFLAALGLAGFFVAASLARHWQDGAASTLTVQVPDPGLAMEPGSARGETRRDRVVAMLARTPGVVSARALSDDELNELLAPWIGAGPNNGLERLTLPLPGVVQVRLGATPPKLDELERQLAAAVPRTLVESHQVWIGRLATLARSLQACAGGVLVVVAGVAAAVVAAATRAGLVQRRQAIEIVHGLGATDGYIAGRFTRRTTRLAAIGGLLGATAALPVLLGLAQLGAPFVSGGAEAASAGFPQLPALLWFGLPALPVAAGAIGFVTAQATVRSWLRRLP